MDEEPSIERQIDELKTLRQSIDACINEIETQWMFKDSDALQVARTRLIEAKMWAGKHYEFLGRGLPSQYQDKAE